MKKMFVVIKLNEKHRDMTLQQAMMADDHDVQFIPEPTGADIIITDNDYTHKYIKEVVHKPFTIDTFNLQLFLNKLKEIIGFKDSKDLVQMMYDKIYYYFDLKHLMDSREKQQLVAMMMLLYKTENVKKYELIVAIDDIEKYQQYNVGDLFAIYDAGYTIDNAITIVPGWYNLKQDLL
jgi:hypothetical protein